MDPRTLAPLSNDDIKAEMADLDSSIKLHLTAATDHERLAHAERGEIARLQRRLDDLRNELDRRNRPAPIPRISDHALLRYIERIHGVDISLLKETILTPAIVSAIQTGASAVIFQGVRFVVKDNVIVTTVDDTQRERPRAKRQGARVASSPDQLIAEGIEEYEQERNAAQ